MVRIKKKVKRSQEEILLEKQKSAREKAGIQDEFQTKGFELVHFVQNHRTSVTIFLALLVALGLGWSGFLFWEGKTDTNASDSYVAALDLLDEKPDDKNVSSTVVAALKKVSEDFSASKVSGMAQLYAGHLLLNEGKFVEAQRIYQSFVSGQKKSSQLRFLGLVGLAYALVEGDKKEEALATYEEILETNWNVERDVWLWSSANLAQSLGRVDLSIKRATELRDEFPHSGLALDAEGMLASLEKKE